MAISLLLLCAAPATAASSGRVLASGDSMIQIVDGYIAKKVRSQHFRLRSDAHVGTGISKPAQFDWVAHARKLAISYRPSATVVFLGANEGFPLRWDGKRRNCCSRAWRKAYAARAQAMMQALERDGAARVYWLTLPAARPSNWNHIYRSVNLALRTAARREGDGVRLIDMGAVFTPSGRFQQTIVRDGRHISVRQADGIHLNVAGARIAARVVVRQMRADQLFR
ncbi:MAG: uncharacterized protein QOJ57_1458 [Thermoleophilaceae bacterium]|nr:uncharacterized protein [Thermoleophilaceae bacterium]